MCIHNNIRHLVKIKYKCQKNMINAFNNFILDGGFINIGLLL